MRDLKSFIAGLGILMPHYKPGETFGAEHDMVYLYPTSTPLSADEVAELKKLGFQQTDDYPEDTPYDPENGWAFWV
jgi:hypothetical protein